MIEVVHQDHHAESNDGAIDFVVDDPANFAKNRLAGRAEAEPQPGADVAAETIGVVTQVELCSPESAGKGVNRKAAS